MRLCLPSPAKLNLFLYITGRRDDGYHSLQTLFQFLDFSDTVTIESRSDSNICLVSPVADVPHDDNLIVKAARLLQRSTGCSLGATINIDKQLPLGGGLGGGSSNAATTLLGLNRLWSTGYSLQQLAELGLKLGADVPVFIQGQSAFAEGVGEVLCPAAPEEKWYLIVYPNIKISTAAIFNDPELRRNTPKRDLNQLLNLPFYNDCEPVVRKRFPEVEQLLLWLLEYAPARLTGTGACVFAEFDTETAARELLNQIPTSIHGFVAKGVNVSPLHRALTG